MVCVRGLGGMMSCLSCLAWVSGGLFERPGRREEVFLMFGLGHDIRDDLCARLRVVFGFAAWGGMRGCPHAWPGALMGEKEKESERSVCTVLDGVRSCPRWPG